LRASSKFINYMKCQSRFGNSKLVLLTGVLGAALLLTGCETPKLSVRIARGPLPSNYSPREGSLGVAPFKDTRPVGQRPVIGISRTASGAYNADFVAKGEKSIEALMQGFFEDALRQLGYKTTAAEGAKVVLEGEVFEWWLEGSGFNNVTQIGVLMRLRDRERDGVLWEREVRGQGLNLFSYGAATRDAVDVTLANTIREFASTDFYQAVQPRNDAPSSHSVK
jgi:hypothetical protein